MLSVVEVNAPATRALASLLFCLGLYACGDDDASPEPAPAASAGAGQAGSGGAGSSSGAAGSSGACTPAQDCTPIDTSAIVLEPCCSASIACGYTLLEPAELREIFRIQLGMVEGTDAESGCVPESIIYRKQLGSTGPNEQRIAVPGGTDVLLAHGCESVILLGIPFAGCCLPGGCGISTYGVTDTLGVLANDPSSPFAQVQCTTSAELNAQLAGTTLESLARFPDTAGSCDYEALAAAHPPMAQ